MPKKRRLLNSPVKNKAKISIKDYPDSRDGDVWNARGRLKGALMDALEPTEDESDTSLELNSSKQDRIPTNEPKRDANSESDEEKKKPVPQRQSYVLKLFDRSVDLSQFNEDSPLYPICRAWITNQPKANYSELGKKNKNYVVDNDEGIELPGPDGPKISRIPELLPEQKACSKDNINLNYKEAHPISAEDLIQEHSRRWARVRRAWIEQGAKVEERYHATQEILNDLSSANST